VSNTLILFAKAPRLGTVKTRLHGALSKPRVRQLYVAFLKDTLALASRVREVRRRVIAFTPTDGEQSLRKAIGSCARGFEFIPQSGGDLGERMRHAFETQTGRTVILGTDSPTLPARLVEDAFAALRRNDLVLGASTDGGYYLIGLSVPDSGFRVAKLFRGVRWSTERVLEQTIANARRARLKLHLLDPWYDVDDPASLRFLRTHVQTLTACASKEVPKYTWRVLRDFARVRLRS
jgi:hypothetical protein